MAQGKSSFLEGKVLDWIFAMSEFTTTFNGLDDVLTITNFHFAIFKGDPETSGVEVTGGSYAREAVGFGAANWTRTGSQVVNDNDIDFGTATADWATALAPATHIAVFDAASSGNRLFSSQLIAPRTILNGDPFKIPAGQAKFTED